jgi:hypothetical protein
VTSAICCWCGAKNVWPRARAVPETWTCAACGRGDATVIEPPQERDALRRIAELLETHRLVDHDMSPHDVYLAVRAMAYEHARMRSELMRIVDAADRAREMLDGFEGAR